MDEAQEKITEARLASIILNWRDNLDNTMMTPQELAQTLMRVLAKEFNYHQLPKDKPPLLDTVVLRERAKNIVGASYGSVIENVSWIAQTQREADIKHYEANT